MFIITWHGPRMNAGEHPDVASYPGNGAGLGIELFKSSISYHVSSVVLILYRAKSHVVTVSFDIESRNPSLNHRL